MDGEKDVKAFEDFEEYIIDITMDFLKGYGELRKRIAKHYPDIGEVIISWEGWWWTKSLGWRRGRCKAEAWLSSYDELHVIEEEKVIEEKFPATRIPKLAPRDIVA